MSSVEKGRPPGGARRRFTEEFKAGAVALVSGGDRPVGRHTNSGQRRHHARSPPAHERQLDWSPKPTDKGTICLSFDGLQTGETATTNHCQLRRVNWTHIACKVQSLDLPFWSGYCIRDLTEKRSLRCGDI